MNFTTSSTNQLIRFLFAGLLIIWGSLQSGNVEPSLLVVSIFVTITFFIQLWNEMHTSDKSKKRNAVIYSLFFISLIISIFPFHLTNPFSIFHYSFIRSLFLISIPTLLLWSDGDEKKQERLIFYAPMLLLILLNSYYILFDFNGDIKSDQARHCVNVFQIYDLITSQDAYKLLQSITYYDFYQPLVYIVSFPFLLIFGKSYTAATISLPLFWLPIGYVSAFKFFKNYAKIKYTYASVFTFVIFGSVVATSLTKQLMLDFPALCMVCFYNYRLAKSGYLKNTNQSFYVGLIFGLGLLTKSNFLLLAIVPLFFSIIRLLIKCFRNRFEFKNLFTSVLLHIIGMILGGGFWYLLNNDHYSYQLPDVTTLAGQNEGDPMPMSIASILWYPAKFLYYFSPIVLSVILIGFFFSIKYFGKRKLMNYLGYASILFAYIIGTITWNKDVRTLLPATFYFYPALLGFVFIRNQLLRNTGIFLMVFITFLINISFVNNNKLKIASYLTSGPYTIPWQPHHPSTMNYAESYHIYNKLFKENFGDIIPPKLHSENSADLFTDRMNLSQYPINYKQNLQDTIGYAILFYRNKVWPDYYLFKTKCQNGNLYIQKIGEHKHIGGDVKIFISEGFTSIREANVGNSGNEIIIPIDTNAAHISFSFREFHAWPQSSISKLLFKIIGDTQYSWDNIPLIPLSNNEEKFTFRKVH